MRTRRIIYWMLCMLCCAACFVFISVWKFSDTYWVSRGYNIARKHADRVMAAWYQRREPVRFRVKKLENLSIERPTSLQFGPNGKLYVSSQDGTINGIEVEKDQAGAYHVKQVEKIDLIRQISNHNDIGSIEQELNARQVTGILVTGTADQPKIYVTSSDPRIGGIIDSTSTDPDGDLNLDTNSGMLSVLKRNGDSWQRIDLVRGLPRSEENHGPNGMALDTSTNTLYVTCGGNTNAGSPSRAYGMLSEYAYSAAILSVDLKQLESMPVLNDNGAMYVYDLPTLDDPTRANTPDGRDEGDPFGGNNGLNQAKLDPNGPVKVFSPGYRNPYDLVLTGTGTDQQRLYTIDNGPNTGHGGYPDQENSSAVTNRYVEGEPGSMNDGPDDHEILNLDNLHLVYGPGMEQPIYGGHPNPIRANPDSAGLSWIDSQRNFSRTPTSDWPPVPVTMADPRQSDYRNPSVDDGTMAIFYGSTNGISEYRAGSYFKGTLKGDLITASFTGQIFRIRLKDSGDEVHYLESLAKGFGNIPLDVTCQGDFDPFPGTIWIADYGNNSVYILEPDTAPAWALLESIDGSVPDHRHESGFVECNGKFYQIGGRGTRALNVFDPQIGTWSTSTALPGNVELNHFQAAAIDSLIYILGGFTGEFPSERAVPEIYVFNTLRNAWKVLEQRIPEQRLRGSVAVSAFEGKLYLCGGNTRGHNRGAVPWTDAFDPSTGKWTILADAPHARDHFQTAVHDGKMYVAGGRRTDAEGGKLFQDTEPSVDIYDINSNTWETLPESANLPTGRAGAATVCTGSQLLVIGGESKAPKAHQEVESLDLTTHKWSRYPNLVQGRHGTQAVFFKHNVYIAGGCARQGGSPELNTMEILRLSSH